MNTKAGNAVMASEGGVPSVARLIWPTLLALRTFDGPATTNQILDAVVVAEHLTPGQQEELLPSGIETKLHNRIGWSIWMLRRGEAAISTTRGRYTVAPLGASLTEEDTHELHVRVNNDWGSNRRKPAIDTVSATATDVDGFEAKPELEDRWHDDLLAILLALQPAAFERVAKRLLDGSGFTKVEVTGRSGDGGIDGTGVLRIADLLSFHVLFQCKRYKGVVGAPEIRNFRGAMMGRSDKGLFITTGSFTTEARREATRDGAPPIDLIDGDQLCELLKQRGIGVRTRQVEVVEIDAAFFSGI